MSLLSIVLIGFGLIAIGAGVLMATRPEQAWRVERMMAELTGRVKVERGEHWGTLTAFNVILIVVGGVIAIAIGLLTWGQAGRPSVAAKDPQRRLDPILQ